MKIFLSALQSQEFKEYIDKKENKIVLESKGKKIQMLWNLLSFYYICQGKNFSFADAVRDSSEQILIDSGAHSFQKGKKVDWVEYTKTYAKFMKSFDRPNVLGFFEMDVDNILGYDKVLYLRKILEKEGVPDKVIPVWHKNRGVEDFKEMCRRFSGKVVAVTGFQNEDIRDDQYLMFLKYAHLHNCRLHCLGMTRTKVLDMVPFDYADSASWKLSATYGRVGDKKVAKRFTKTDYNKVRIASYLEAMKMQKHYFLKWRKENKEKEL